MASLKQKRVWYLTFKKEVCNRSQPYSVYYHTTARYERIQGTGKSLLLFVLLLIMSL
jgi:hypothetical protein